MALFARYGYVGGRVHCLAGCTSRWLLKRADGADVTPPTNRQRKILTVRCRTCDAPFTAKASNAMRCLACRREIHRQRAMIAQRRYVSKKGA